MGRIKSKKADGEGGGGRAGDTLIQVSNPLCKHFVPLENFGMKGTRLRRQVF